jgi:O-antigen/teichoic acid export membrane protein
MLKKIISNKFVLQSLSTMFLRVVGIVVLFGFTLFLTHNYDPKLIGQYDFIRSFLLIIGSICIIGTDQSILYFMGILKSESLLNDLKSVYKKMIILIFLVYLVLFAVFFVVGKERIVSFFNDEQSFFNMFKAMAVLFFYAVTLFNTETLRALERIYIAELFRNSIKYLSVIVGAVVLFYFNHQQYLVDTFLVGFIIQAVVTTLMVLKSFKKIGVRKSATSYTTKFIFYKSFPIAMSTMAIFLLMSFDIMFLKKYTGDATVAYYAIAVKLIAILLMVMNSVTITVSTKIAEQYNLKNYEELQLTMKNSSRLIFFISLPLVLLFIIFPEQILSVFGSEFLKAKTALIILAIGQGICSLFGAVQVYFNMTGRQNIFQAVLLVAVIINFFLNMKLIPLYGMNGAAISYAASMIFWNLTIAVIVYKKDKLWVFLN